MWFKKTDKGVLVGRTTQHGSVAVEFVETTEAAQFFKAAQFGFIVGASRIMREEYSEDEWAEKYKTLLNG